MPLDRVWSVEELVSLMPEPQAKNAVRTKRKRRNILVGMTLAENIAFVVLGIFFAVGAFLANGGKYDIFSRSRAKPISAIGRGLMFFAGLLIVFSALLRIFSN
jgi:hypothetical protein